MSATVLRVVSLGLAVLLAATGCAGTSPASRPVQTGPTSYRPQADGREDASRVELCVKKVTLVRAEYQRCDDAMPGYALYYVPLSSQLPAIRKKVANGTFVEPATAPLRARADGGTFRDDQDRIEICVRERTRVRVEDGRCDGGDHAWYYLLLSHHVPAVGGTAAGGSFRLPRLSESFRGRPGGGKGSAIALRPQDDAAEADETPSEQPSERPTERPSTRPSTRPSRTTVPVPTAKTCTTIRRGKVTTRRCS